MSDLRKVHWQEIASQDWLTDLRLRCYEYLLQHEATADEVARAIGADRLAVRPRCSELHTGLPRDASNPLILAETTGKRRDNAHVLRAIPYSVALERWRQREAIPGEPPRPARGYLTATEALNDMPLADACALCARYLKQKGERLKRYETNRTDQLSLAV